MDFHDLGLNGLISIYVSTKRARTKFLVSFCKHFLMMLVFVIQYT